MGQHAVMPTEWCGEPVDLIRVNEVIGYAFMLDKGDTSPWVWHWCPVGGAHPTFEPKPPRWICLSTTVHTVEQENPLTLSPSLLMRCCGMHGFIRDGKWVGTND